MSRERSENTWFGRTGSGRSSSLNSSDLDGQTRLRTDCSTTLFKLYTLVIRYVSRVVRYPVQGRSFCTVLFYKHAVGARAYTEKTSNSAIYSRGVATSIFCRYIVGAVAVVGEAAYVSKMKKAEMMVFCMLWALIVDRPGGRVLVQNIVHGAWYTVAA